MAYTWAFDSWCSQQTKHGGGFTVKAIMSHSYKCSCSMGLVIMLSQSQRGWQ